MTDLVEVSIRWRGEGDTVSVAGEFNKWDPQHLNKQGDGSWVTKLRLSPGKYMYKFVVDGEWVINQDMPTTADGEGNRNNLLEVEDGENSGDSDSWEKVSIPDTETGDSGGDGSGLQKIAVVERVYSLSGTFDDALEDVEKNEGSVVECSSMTDEYYDTEEYHLMRRGVWLKQRSQGDTKCWQLRTLANKELEICDNVEEILKHLGTELGEVGTLEEIVRRRLQEITRVTLDVRKCRIGETEIEIRREGEVETALVRVVGEIVTALKELEESARKLKFVPFNVPSLVGKLTGKA